MLAARPAFAQKAAGGDADVVVVGAGAAGIAAARRLAAEKLNVLVFEAQDRIGGRCVTDTKTFGVPFDLGAHWIHTPPCGRPLNVRSAERLIRAGNVLQPGVLVVVEILAGQSLQAPACLPRDR